MDLGSRDLVTLEDNASFENIVNNPSGVLVNGDVNVISNLVINAGTKITIPVSKYLNVEGVITNNAGVGGLIIEAAAYDVFLDEAKLVTEDTFDEPTYP
jgi:hypothetical protein